MTDNLKEREAFKQYLSECDDCAIVPDVAGAFAWAWRAALAQAQSCVLADDLLRLANAWRNAMTTRGHVDAGNAMEEAMRRLAASPQPQPVQPSEVAQQWQPIETAPKDGTRVLATWDYTWCQSGPHAEVCETNESGEWFYSYDGDGPQKPPTHWMPLPAPPKPKD